MKKVNKLWQLAFLAALATNLLAYGLITLFGLITLWEWPYLLICFAITTLVTYLTVLFIIREFVFRKVKPIYKIIRQAKLEKTRDQRQFLSDDILERVEDEVRTWVLDTKTEMETLQTMSRYRKEYLGNISHELKTPIFNMQGYIHSLLDGAMYDEKYLEKFLKKAANNIERLNTIVQDLDLISKIESATITLEMEKFELKDLVVDLFEELKGVAKTKNITLVLKSQNSDEFKVNADRNAVRQILINLITNSIKYGNEGGTTKVGFYDMDQYLLVEVTDDGQGIDQKHIPHLFDRFYRVEKSRVRGEGGVEGGSGLGLAIVKHLVDAHQQTISVRSTVGVGSTFGFTLEKS